MQDCLINFRNCCVSNYGVNIIYLYKHNKIVDMSISKLKYILSFLCCIPFKLLSKFIKYNNYNIIYTMDNLYYTTNIIENHITPVILNISLYSNLNNPKKKLYIDTNVDSPISIPINNNSPTIIKNYTVSLDNTPEMSNINTALDCSNDNNILTVNECPDDKDITMVEISDKKDNDTIMIDTTEIKNTDNNYLDVTSNFKLYNNSIPLWVFIKNENVNLEMYNIIKIKYMLNNKIEFIDINIAQNINKLLYELFNTIVV